MKKCENGAFFSIKNVKKLQILFLLKGLYGERGEIKIGINRSNPL